MERRRADFRRTVHKNTVQDGKTVTYKSTDALTIAAAIDRLEGELRRLGAEDVLLSTNVPLSLRGMPLSVPKEPADPGAAVYITLHRKPLVFASDKWDRVADNIAAIAQHIDALRRIDRYGVGSLDQAFAGYAALPQSVVEQSWRAVLGYEPSAMPKPEEIEDRFRQLARQHHPDVGGEHDMMSALSIARHNGLAEMNPEGGP